MLAMRSSEENVERKEQAEQMAMMIRTEAESLGAIASVEVLSAAYDPPRLI